MTRCPVEVEFSDVWGKDLVVSLALEMFTDEGLQFLTNDSPSRGPEHEALTNILVDVKELEVFSEFPMVTFFGFFHSVKRGFEGFFGWLNETVNPNQLFPVLIRPPVRRRNRCQTNEHQSRSVGDVRAEAKVVPFALFVNA